MTKGLLKCKKCNEYAIEFGETNICVVCLEKEIARLKSLFKEINNIVFDFSLSNLIKVDRIEFVLREVDENG